MWKFDPVRPIAEYEGELFDELRFSRFALDEEYEKQPSLYMKWSYFWGKALVLRKKAEDDLEKTKADLDLAVRKSPKGYDLIPDDKGKVMESAIKSTVAKQPDIIEAQEHFYEVYELAKLFEHAVKAFEQRKELLRGEGDLWVNQYYSGVKVKEQRADREKRKEDVQEDLADKIPDRRKRGTIE